MNNKCSEKENAVKMPHTLSLIDRQSLNISGVTEVDEFDDEAVAAYTTLGKLNIKGEMLHIRKLNLEFGELEITGKVSSLVYTNSKNKSQSGFIKKFFK